MTEPGSTSSPSLVASSPPPSLPGSWQGLVVSIAGHVTSLIVTLEVVRPIGRVLPSLIQLVIDKGEWKPVTAALVALGMCAAPADTARLVRSLIPKRAKE